jgi:hypothetical protein
VSFLTKIRKVVHTTPVLRQVSKGFAEAWGGGQAYAEFDRKIGISESGEPVPSQDQYQGFGRSDLAALAAERYPGTAALVTSYRESESQFRRIPLKPSGHRVEQPLDYEDSDYSLEDLGDDGDDYIDEEE